MLQIIMTLIIHNLTVNVQILHKIKLLKWCIHVSLNLKKKKKKKKKKSRLSHKCQNDIVHIFTIATDSKITSVLLNIYCKPMLIKRLGRLGLWCLTPLSTIFQLYRWSVLLVEETEVPGENHRPVACHRQTLSQGYSYVIFTCPIINLFSIEFELKICIVHYE